MFVGGVFCACVQKHQRNRRRDENAFSLEKGSVPFRFGNFRKQQIMKIGRQWKFMISRNSGKLWRVSAEIFKTLGKSFYRSSLKLIHQKKETRADYRSRVYAFFLPWKIVNESAATGEQKDPRRLGWSRFYSAAKCEMIYGLLFILLLHYVNIIVKFYNLFILCG